MKVIIYESSSKGGCYEYAHYLYRSLLQKCVEVSLLVPANSGAMPIGMGADNRLKNLLSDEGSSNRIVSKLLFLYRQLVNPLKFLFFLRKQPASIIIWNDFEQLTAPFWTLLLRCIAAKHTHTVVLHDPDRDNYPPFKWYSEWCMKCMMRVMQIGYYHSFLPDKSYYAHGDTCYVSIIHGVFDTHTIDPVFYQELNNEKGNQQLLSILGNLREEKNYRLVIEALKYLPETTLLIAGAPANSSVDIQELKDLALNMGVADRIIWRIKFLSDQELATCIEISDVLVLYYQQQFKSQSGILNLIAPYQKKFVYSDTESGLAIVCKQYGIGTPCSPDSINKFVQTIQDMSTHHADAEKRSWEDYLKKADWSGIYDSLQANKN